MRFPDKCPFCGAELSSLGFDGKHCKSYGCGTTISHQENPERMRSRDCRIAERDGLKSRVTELEARYERLRKLADELRVCAGYLGWTSSDDSDCITRAERACDAWDKEDKG